MERERKEERFQSFFFFFFFFQEPKGQWFYVATFKRVKTLGKAGVTRGNGKANPAVVKTDCQRGNHVQ